MLKKSVFKISGMHCNTCSLNIDWELEETDGVKEVKTSYAAQKTELTFDDDLISSKKIIEIIKKTGYEANLIKE
ncbi:heavy-metal-associated domain-containing protein [Candidatus Gottesmanbacteria bacterium]|nr:heavy-metal-associated domain-containing protein [Candidatus Gottesmanbacteria bacterium]